jgi:hypothetical protein
VVVLTNAGPIYDGTGVIFTGVVGCGDPVCPRSSTRAALLVKCSDNTVHYFSVEEDTAFEGAAYLYNGECYSFVEFSGPGGPDVGSPDYQDCATCQPTPTPTPSSATPTPTPTVSATPAACNSDIFCLSTTFPSLSGYNGNYYSASTYNDKIYYSGDGVTTGFIYWNTGTTGYWCLSSSLGGSCLLQGASPCYSACPDLSNNVWSTGLCPTPTPTPINCAPFNFLAYFDCDWEPIPTPTPSIPCDLVDFDFNILDLTPTPTPTADCLSKSVNFSLSGYTPSGTPTPSNTPTVTLTRTVAADGSATYVILDETFSCSTAKVLIDCSTGEEFYTSDALSLSGTPIDIGITMLAIANGVYRCLYYDRDDSNLSSNTNIDEVISISSSCNTCSNIPTPTPSVTQTQTPTTTPSLSTPTPTPTTTQTPSPTATVGTTPPVTPTQTATPSASNTPTPSITASPSATPNYLYVYESCEIIQVGGISKTQIIQTEKVSGINVETTIFKDNSSNCWTYVGRFDTSYIPPFNVIPISWTGNYFGTINSSITYPTCVECTTVPVGGCNTIYFSATRCDNGATVFVRACDLGESPLITLTPFVGQTHGVINPSGDDFCVTLDSLTTPQPISYILGTAAYTTYTCATCPLYKIYYANSCDGFEQNVLVYASSTSTTLLPGQVVTVDTNSTCYSIVSYEGIVIEQNVIQGITPQINSNYNDCSECAAFFNGLGGGGIGGGGGSIS